MHSVKVIDNDKGEIIISLGTREVRSYMYRDDSERRLKMLLAHEFAEGWFVRSLQSDVAKD
jgi:hypothetical protein